MKRLLGQRVSLDSNLFEMLEWAARIRARRQTTLPDALHAATALVVGCPHLVTIDVRMPALNGLEVVRVQDLEELRGG